MDMDLASETRTPTLFILAVLSLAGGFALSSHGFSGRVTGSALVDTFFYGSMLTCMCASVLVFYRPGLGYIVGALGGLVALLCIVQIESWLGESSWIVLNAPADLRPDEGGIAAFDKFIVFLRIASAALFTSATLICLLRLLRSPLSQHTRLALAFGFLVIALWFTHAIMPYRLPLIVDALPAELRILHVEKHSLRIEETAVSVYRNGRFHVNQSQRTLFRYGWRAQGVSGVLTQTRHDDVRALINSQELAGLQTLPARQLRSWDAAAWYVVLKDRRLLAFTSEYQTRPPRQITTLFQEIRNSPTSQSHSWPVLDICLGFCYGPAAALGFQYPNQACFALWRGGTECR
jgi:hypothetical protein